MIKLDKKSRSENNYRQYDAHIIQRLLLIKQIKSFGFTLKEIEDLLILDEINELSCLPVAEILNHKIEKLEEKIKDLQNQRSKLLLAKASCSGNCKDVLTK